MNIESRFEAVLDLALDIADDLTSLAIEGKDGPTIWDDFPDSTILRLLPMAQTEYRAAVVLLRNGLTADATTILMRSLAELVSHVAWVNGIKPFDQTPAERRYRAMCLELGMGDENNNSLRQLSLVSIPPSASDATERNNRRILELRRLLEADGRKAHSRNFKHVRPALEALGKQIGRPFVHDVWVSASLVSHQLAPNTFLHDLGDGILRAGPASVKRRGELLDHTVTLFALLGLASIGCVNSENANRWITRYRALTSEPEYVRAVTGALE